MSSRRRGPGRPTLHEAAERDAQLLDTALELFVANGFERTTIEAITTAVGMAKRTVYARYCDKTTLFKAALQRAIDDWAIPVARLEAAETADLEASLHAIARILVDNILSPAGLRLLRITNAESPRMPEIGVYTNEQGTKRTVAFLAELLHRRIPHRPFTPRDAEAAAFSFLFLVVGGPATMAAWGIGFNQPEIDRHIRNGVHLFLHGPLDEWDWSPARTAPQQAR